MSAPVIHPDLIQGTDEWLAARCGLLTASEIGKLLTPAGKPADNATARDLMADLVAQRITRHVEARFITDDMLRGMDDEPHARALYEQHHAPVEQVGFITREIEHDGVRFTLGYSPDGLVAHDGLIEIKSRRPKFQVQTILRGDVPAEFETQIQVGLLVSGRSWCDFISYSGGLPLFVCRAWRCDEHVAAILDACAMAERRMQTMQSGFDIAARALIPTERRTEQEMVI